MEWEPQPPIEEKKKGMSPAQAGSVLFMVLTIIVLLCYATIFVNPQIMFNPFKPPAAHIVQPTTVGAASVDNVVLLPNNSNVILAAEQAKALAQKNVLVVPTKTMPQGVSAMLAFNYQADLETNARVMARAAGDVETIEVTTATRDVEINGVAVKEGQSIGLLNDRLHTASSSPEQVVLTMLGQLALEDFEIITVYWGEDVTPDEAGQLVAHIETLYADIEVELVEGGQPHYDYILSLE